ncbi:MAG: ClpXP protease specificity-enhancing factor SspB, partial [Hyphomonas sp.]
MTDYIGYEALTQAAMRGVVREALRKGYNSNGLPGDHHFYLTFRTKAPGVKIADYLVERFPEEMTIVIQHQYWDLEVEDSHFEIILKFSGVPQHLHIPYAAITRFVDPS